MFSNIKGGYKLKSFLKERKDALNDLYTEIFELYPKKEILGAVQTLLVNISKFEVLSTRDIEVAMQNVLNKTETYNVLLTLNELDKRCSYDEELVKSMRDVSYNQHRTIAINICDMYGSGATSLFGYIDCTFRDFFPNNIEPSFLSKGVAALVASIAESVLTGDVTEDYKDINIKLLESRGIAKREMVEMVFDLQNPYNSELTMEMCEEHVDGVLKKQQTYHTIQLCLKIDMGVEAKEFGYQFNEIVGNDEGLYGIDETVNTSISKMYGMIAITNFGYLDKSKPGIIGRLDNDHLGDNCNTFADDTVCAIVSAACARLAHNNSKTNSKPARN